MLCCRLENSGLDLRAVGQRQARHLNDAHLQKIADVMQNVILVLRGNALMRICRRQKRKNVKGFLSQIFPKSNSETGILEVPK